MINLIWPERKEGIILHGLNFTEYWFIKQLWEAGTLEADSHTRTKTGYDVCFIRHGDFHYQLRFHNTNWLENEMDNATGRQDRIFFIEKIHDKYD